MPAWLEDNGALLLGLLALAAGFSLVAWWRRRKRPLLVAAGALAGLAALGALYLYARAPETDRQQIRRKILAMGDAVKARNAQGIFTHLSDEFRFRSMDKAQFRNLAEQAMRTGQVQEVRVFEIDFPSNWLEGAGTGKRT